MKIPNSVLIAACSALALVALISLTGFTNGEPQTQAAAVQPATQPATEPQPQMKLAPQTPIAEKKEELGDDETWHPEWDVLVEEALPPDFLTPQVSRAVKPFCPRFSSLNEPDKRAFWAYLFQALAGAEAGLRPTTSVRHTEPEVAVKDDVTHRIVRQQGLLQLTYMDSQRYGCEFDWDTDKSLDEHDPAKTILQPKNNLLCGVKILHNQIIDQHKPLLSGTSYWVTLRPDTMSFKVFLKQMANVPASCGRHSARKAKPEPVREASNSAVPSQPIADGAH